MRESRACSDSAGTEHALERGILRVIVLALLAAAAFESSTWVGGVTFALAAPAIGAVLLRQAERNERWRLFARFAVAAALTISLAAPFLHDQLAMAASRDVTSPVALHPFAVLGAAFPDHLRRVLDVPAYWLVLLPVEFPAIVLTGALAAAALLRANLDRPAHVPAKPAPGLDPGVDARGIFDLDQIEPAVGG